MLFSDSFSYIIYSYRTYLRIITALIIIILSPRVIFPLQKAQPNGRAVAEPQEEAIVSEETVPHHQPPPPEAKAEKVVEVIFLNVLESCDVFVWKDWTCPL